MSTTEQTAGEMCVIINGGARICTAEEYHAAHDYIGHSMLDVFRDNPALYHGRYVTGTIMQREPSEAMLLGTLVHLLVLEPHRWGDVMVAPECDKRTKAGKELWAAFCEQSAGKLVVPKERYELAQRIAAAVWAHDEANQLLSLEGPTEHAIWWTDDDTDLKLKALRDKATPGILVDLKTCSDASPQAFAKAVANNGYFRQQAHYVDGHLAVTGERPQFYFVAAQTTEPLSVAVYRLEDSAEEFGRQQNRKALQGLAACYESGDWRAPFSKGVINIPLPRYAVYQSDWEDI